MKHCNPVINFEKENFDQNNINIISFDRLVQHPTPHLHTPHRGELNRLFWIEKGKGVLNIDFNRYQLHDNQLYLLSQEPVYFFDDGSVIKGMLILFKNEIVPKVVMFLNVVMQLNINENKEIKEIMSHLLFLLEYEVGHMETKDRLSVLPYYLRAIVQLIVHENKNECENISSQSGLFVRFLEKILLHGNRFFSVAQYAEMLFISEEALYIAVKEYSGQSPKKIIDHYILLEAKRQLSFEFKSIKEIAHDLGFDYPSYFNKFFKKNVGETPLEFRKRHSCIYIVS